MVRVRGVLGRDAVDPVAALRARAFHLCSVEQGRQGAQKEGGIYVGNMLAVGIAVSTDMRVLAHELCSLYIDRANMLCGSFEHILQSMPARKNKRQKVFFL